MLLGVQPIVFLKLWKNGVDLRSRLLMRLR